MDRIAMNAPLVCDAFSTTTILSFISIDAVFLHLSHFRPFYFCEYLGAYPAQGLNDNILGQFLVGQDRKCFYFRFQQFFYITANIHGG